MYLTVRLNKSSKMCSLNGISVGFFCQNAYIQIFQRTATVYFMLLGRWVGFVKSGWSRHAVAVGPESTILSWLLFKFSFPCFVFLSSCLWFSGYIMNYLKIAFDPQSIMNPCIFHKQACHYYI